MQNIFRIQKSLEQQLGNIFINGLPHDIWVDVKVGVNEAITHTDHVFPGNVIVLFF